MAAITAEARPVLRHVHCLPFTSRARQGDAVDGSKAWDALTGRFNLRQNCTRPFLVSGEFACTDASIRSRASYRRTRGAL